MIRKEKGNSQKHKKRAIYYRVWCNDKIDGKKKHTKLQGERERKKERERSFRVENDQIEASRAGRGQDPRRWARGVLQPSTLLNFEIGCLL